MTDFKYLGLVAEDKGDRTESECSVGKLDGM